MIQLLGILSYSTWLDSWLISGEKDIWPSFQKFFMELHGQRISIDSTFEKLTLRQDDKSPFLLKFRRPEHRFITIEGNGISKDIKSHLETKLVHLNGRCVILERGGNYLSLSPDNDAEKVFKVSPDRENLYRPDPAIIPLLCRKKDTECGFLKSIPSPSGSIVATCMKFRVEEAVRILKNWRHGDFIGNCGLADRRADEKPKKRYGAGGY